MRRTVEAVILPLAFVPVVSGGLPNVSDKQKDRLLYLLKQATEEALPPKVNDRDKSQIMKQARKILFTGLLRTASGLAQSVPETSLSLYYFITNMIEQDLYYISNESAFMDFFDGALPAMDYWRHFTEISLNGFNQARYALKTLNQQGYYHDVEWRLIHE